MYDLPQIYQKPSPEALVQVLEKLAQQPPSFSLSSAPGLEPAEAHINPHGVPQYLTSVVSSPLGWIKKDELKERIWDLASIRLSERSGRNAMPSMTRRFQVTDDLTIDLHEPSMTEDNFGLKTWTSSLVLSRLLPTLQRFVPDKGSILELGAGTGLLGLSAAYLWKADVLLSDLPVVVPNLEHNLLLNRDIIQDGGGRVSVRALDWSDKGDIPNVNSEQFKVILAADPIYSPDHPTIFVHTISKWLKNNADARLVLALPLRGLYQAERLKLRELLKEARLKMLEDGTDVAYDDWYTREGEPVEVKCWWSIWQPVIPERKSNGARRLLASRINEWSL